MAFYRPKYSQKRYSGAGLRARIFDSALRYRQWIFQVLRKRRSRPGFPAAGRPGRIRPSHLLAAAALLLFFIGGGMFCYHRLAASDVFRLTELTVLGNRVVERREIIERSGLRQGIGLLGFDVEAARNRVEELDWIDTATIRVLWPAKVEIRVREHRALALVQYQDSPDRGLHYMDGKGMIFARVGAGQELDFPVLTGFPANRQDQGQAETSLKDKALTLLRLAARGNPILPIQAISEIHLDPGNGLTVYLVDHPFPIYMGRQGIRTKYYRLVRILDRLYRKKKIAGIREIRMDYLENKVLVALAVPGK